MLRLTLSIAAVAVCGSLAGQADAVVIERNYLSHGVANCQSALPVFDGNIRKRPKALANEGSGVAFVTCDFDSITNTAPNGPCGSACAGTGSSRVYVQLNNRSGGSATVSCTFVNGYGDTVFSPSLVRSVTMPAGASQVSLSVSGNGDNAGDNFAAPSISCALPPGVEIMGVGQAYPEEVGA